VATAAAATVAVATVAVAAMAPVATTAAVATGAVAAAKTAPISDKLGCERRQLVLYHFFRRLFVNILRPFFMYSRKKKILG
jgi:hypothetical protein